MAALEEDEGLVFVRVWVRERERKRGGGGGFSNRK